MSDKKEKNKLFGNIASLGVVNIANYLFPLITVPIVSRALGPDKIGTINYISSVLTYFSLLIAYSFNTTGVRRVAKDSKNISFVNETFSVVFVSQCLFFIVSTILFSISLFTIKELKVEFALSCITYLVCLTSLFTQNWIFQAKQDLKIIAILNFIPRLLSVLLVVFFVHKADDYIKYAAILYVIPLIIAIFSFFYSIWKYKIKLFIPNVKRIWTVIKEDRFVFFSSVLINLYTTTGVVILGSYRSVDEVAYYTSAQRLIELGRSIVLLPISQSLFPMIAHSFANGNENGKVLIKNILPAFILLTVLILLGTTLLGPFVIKIMYGPQFLPTIPLLEILAWGASFVYFGVLFGHIMLCIGLDKYFFRFTFWGAIISLSFNFLLIKKVGSMGTAIIWSFTEFFIMIYQLFILRKNNIEPLKWIEKKDFRNIIKNLKQVK